MLTVTVGELIFAEDAIVKLQQKAQPQEKENTGISLALAYKIKLLLDALLPEYKDINEQRQKIFDKFGEKLENGTIQIPEKNLAQFNKYFEKLAQIKIDLKNVNKFNMEDLEELDGFTLNDAIKLKPFIEGEDSNPDNRKKIEITFGELDEDQVTSAEVISEEDDKTEAPN